MNASDWFLWVLSLSYEFQLKSLFSLVITIIIGSIRNFLAKLLVAKSKPFPSRLWKGSTDPFISDTWKARSGKGSVPFPLKVEDYLLLLFFFPPLSETEVQWTFRQVNDQKKGTPTKHVKPAAKKGREGGLRKLARRMRIIMIMISYG